MFGSEWIGPVLVSIGLVVVLAAFEVVSIVIASGIGEHSDPAPTRERQKRAA